MSFSLLPFSVVITNWIGEHRAFLMGHLSIKKESIISAQRAFLVSFGLSRRADLNVLMISSFFAVDQLKS